MSLEHSPARAVDRGGNGSFKRMLMSDIEVAALLGCSRASVWRDVDRGLLPRPIRFAGRTRWLFDEVEAAIAKQIAARDAEPA